MPQRGAPQFGASLPHDRRRERPVGPGQFHSERRIRAGQVVPPGRCGFAMVRRSGGATARPLESIWASLPHDRRRERPVGPGQFHSERRIRAGRVVPPGRCGFAMVRRRERPVGPGQFHSERRIRAGRVVPPGRCGFAMAAAGAKLPGHWIRFGPLCRMIAAGRGPSDRAVWCLPGGADLPWCAAAGAQLPGHWIRFGASLPHDRRRERPVGPGRVVPPGRCGFAMVRRSGGAPGHWIRFGASLPHDRRRERPVGPGRVVPPGPCGFAMVRRSRGATARPLDSIWSLSAA